MKATAERLHAEIYVPTRSPSGLRKSAVSASTMASVCYVHAFLDRKTAGIGLPGVSLRAIVAPRTWAPPGYPKIFTPRGA
eukprot:1015612-Prymnesium_polylepis.1